MTRVASAAAAAATRWFSFSLAKVRRSARSLARRSFVRNLGSVQRRDRRCKEIVKGKEGRKEDSLAIRQAVSPLNGQEDYRLN